MFPWRPRKGEHDWRNGMVERRKAAYLKHGVHWRTRIYFGVGAAVIVWLGLGTPTAGVHLASVPVSSWIGTVLSSVVSLVVLAVDAVPGTHAKAVLVFWRLRDPLPGSRAFDRASLDRDTRISRERLLESVGGKFPRAAREQNAAWYRLYKTVEADPVIQAMHFDFLLFRDLAWLSVVLCALALGACIFGHAPLRLLGGAALAFALLYLLFRTAAAERGHRFASQVLVAASSSSTRD
jgi:hypothetical protein